METFFIPTESDFKRWIKEAVRAKDLDISLVILTDWVKRGLPSHKQRGRVYFLRSEVLDYIKTNNLRRFKFSSRFAET